MVSPRKSVRSLTLIPEDERIKKIPSSRKSCESLYSQTSSRSASLSNRRRPQGRGRGPVLSANGNGGRGIKQPSFIPATTEVRQRVLSARRLRMKTYQNQLTEAQQTISDLAHENRMLRTLHKRQDSALSKYESTNAELPQLLHSHSEEVRMWQTKHRQLQQQNKELDQRLKQKEAQVLSLSDQNKYFSQLNKDKNLEERQRLKDQLTMLETRLVERENDFKLMMRKVQLEAKQFRQQLAVEQRRTKEAQLRVEKLRLELSGYYKLDEMQLSDKLSSMNMKRRGGDAKTIPSSSGTFGEEVASEKERQKQLLIDLGAKPRSPKSKFTNSSGTAGNLTETNTAVGVIDSDTTTGTTSGMVKGVATKIQAAAVPKRAKQRPDSGTQLTPLRKGRIDHGDGDASSSSNILCGPNRGKPKIATPVKQSKVNSRAGSSGGGGAGKSIGAAQKDSTPPSPFYEDDYEDITSSGMDDSLDDDGFDFEKYKRELGLSVPNDDDEDDVEKDDDNNDVAPFDADEIDGEHISTGRKLYDSNSITKEEEATLDLNSLTFNNFKAIGTDNAETLLSASDRIKGEIMNIRKQITNDYKNRESFLDTFCRQTTLKDNTTSSEIISISSTSTTSSMPPKGLNVANKTKDSGGSTIPINRKNNLLAALKAIDDTRGQD